MTADILSIGDELLIGQTLNTNAQWISRRLTAMGIGVRHVVTLSDEARDITDSLADSMAHADLVFITGGLGPTSDDITRDVLAGFFGSDLVEDEKIAAVLRGYFEARGREMTPEVADLARVPEKAVTLYNKMGTAPGALYQRDGKVAFSMPGVPYEMKSMMENDVLPWLRDNLELPIILSRHILTAGRGESELADKLRSVEAEMDPALKLAYLPDIGKVKLRLTARGGDEAVLKEKLNAAEQKIVAAVGPFVYGYDDDSLEASIGRDLRELDLTIGTAESCTGGNIAKTITSVAGSSDYFLGSIVSYSNAVKSGLLGVSEATLEENGAVSDPVVRQMLEGALDRLGCDIAIAVSGVAGPGGGTEAKPVGMVYIGVGSRERLWVKELRFTKRRDLNIELTTVVALVMLRKFLFEDYGRQPV